MKQVSFLILLLIILLGGCGPKVPLNKTYYSTPSRLGILYLVDSISLGQERGRQGLVESLLTPGNKYQAALATVADEVYPHDKIAKLFAEKFSNKSEIQLITQEVDLKADGKSANYMAGSHDYYKYDLRRYKEELGVDELLIVEAAHGILVNYYSVVVTNHYGFCQIHAQLVDLKSNRTLYKSVSKGKEELLGVWDLPPTYGSVAMVIRKATEQALAKEREKLP